MVDGSGHPSGWPFFRYREPVQKPDPLTDPLPFNEPPRYPLVVIEHRCCHHQELPKPQPRLELKPFPVPSPNGHVTPTQLLPAVRPGNADEGEPRHRKDGGDGTDMKDILLGCLIGAAAAIFVMALLLIFVMS